MCRGQRACSSRDHEPIAGELIAFGRVAGAGMGPAFRAIGQAASSRAALPQTAVPTRGARVTGLEPYGYVFAFQP